VHEPKAETSACNDVGHLESLGLIEIGRVERQPSGELASLRRHRSRLRHARRLQRWFHTGMLTRKVRDRPDLVSYLLLHSRLRPRTPAEHLDSGKAENQPKETEEETGVENARQKRPRHGPESRCQSQEGR